MGLAAPEIRRSRGLADLKNPCVGKIARIINGLLRILQGFEPRAKGQTIRLSVQSLTILARLIPLRHNSRLFVPELSS